MQKISLILIFCILINRLFCQNYQTISSDRIAFFENKNYYNYSIKCIRIDSLKQDSEDIILYPNRSILDVDYFCFSPNQSSWIGEKIIMQPDYNMYFNLNTDTIKIKTKATVNESWKAYRLIDSTFIIATVISLDTFSFLGLIDSVKTIGFQACDKDSNVIKHQINSKTLQISKNYGFIKIFNFYRFPNFDASFDYHYDTTYNLIGFTNPQTGATNLTKKEVFNFNVGDEIHEVYRHTCGLLQDCKIITIKTIRSYIQKEHKGDSIIYKIDIKRTKSEESRNSYTISYYYDTLNLIITSDSIFDKLPGEPIYEDHVAYVYDMFVNENGRRSKVRQYEGDWIVDFGNDCWQKMIVDGCFPYYEYIEGLGGPFYWCQGWYLDEEENSLVYYKKGESVWGNPLIITNNDDLNAIYSMKIYPNPCNKILQIKIANKNLPCLFEVFDMTGKLVGKNLLQDEITFLNIETYTNGFYIYKATNSHNIVTKGMLIKE